MFDINGRFFSIISRIGDLVTLNVLYIICCIPIITIGAATTAMYSVTQKMAENKENYIAKTFFKKFKENFKKSTIIWIILLIFTTIVSTDLYISNFMAEGIGQTIFVGFMTLSLIIVIFVIEYALTLQCTFENTIKNTLKNAFLMSIMHLPWSILITILTMSPLLSLVFLSRYWSAELFIMLLIWFSGVAYINSFMFNKIYRKYM